MVKRCMVFLMAIPLLGGCGGDDETTGGSNPACGGHEGDIWILKIES